jgi:hypothetical protein
MIEVWSLVRFLDHLDDRVHGNSVNANHIPRQELHPFPVLGDGLLFRQAVVRQPAIQPVNTILHEVT